MKHDWYQTAQQIPSSEKRLEEGETDSKIELNQTKEHTSTEIPNVSWHISNEKDAGNISLTVASNE